MLDSLLDGLKGQLASTMAEKAGIDMGQAEQAVPVAGESIKEGIMGAVSDGDVSGVMSMFSGDDMQSSSIFQKIAGIFTGKLGALGIGGGSALSALALPMILNKIKGAASGESGQMDASGLMNVLGGGGAGGIMGAVTGALGGGGDLLGGLKDKVADVAGDGAGGIMGAVTGAVGGGGDLLGGLKDKVADVAGDGGGILGNAMDAITGKAAEGAEEGGDLKDQAIDAVKDKLGNLFGK